MVTRLLGVRKTISLGKMTIRQAESMLLPIKDLEMSLNNGTETKPSTQEWLQSTGPVLYKKLVKSGLVQPRAVTGLYDFIDDYIKSRTDAKKTTVVNYRRVERYIHRSIPDMPLRVVNQSHADEFERKLKADGFATATVRRSVGISRQFFNAAIRARLIDQNPFAHLSAAVRGNKDRQVFVSRQVAETFLAHCTNTELKAIFALARYGGLRCLSEVHLLQWSDIDWNNQRMTVRSPKTEHHDGKGSRIVPIFPELAPHLQRCFDEAPEGAVHVISRRRLSAAAYAKAIKSVLASCSIKPWPKTFQNLRSTRETELAESHPIHVVCAWMGNSPRVAEEHYLQVTEEHYQQAVGETARTQARYPMHANDRQDSTSANSDSPQDDISVIVRRVLSELGESGRIAELSKSEPYRTCPNSGNTPDLTNLQPTPIQRANVGANISIERLSAVVVAVLRVIGGEE